MSDHWTLSVHVLTHGLTSDILQSSTCKTCVMEQLKVTSDYQTLCGHVLTHAHDLTCENTNSIKQQSINVIYIHTYLNNFPINSNPQYIVMSTNINTQYAVTDGLKNTVYKMFFLEGTLLIGEHLRIKVSVFIIKYMRNAQQLGIHICTYTCIVPQSHPFCHLCS